MRLVVCILHYGDPLLTKRLYEQFTAQDSAYAEAIVVLDNAAPIPYPNAWERLSDNRFWPGALEYALQTFGEKGATHLWFLNNDAEFVGPGSYCQKALQCFEQQSSRGKIGAYSPSMLENPYHRHMVHVPNAHTRDVAYIDGVAPLLNISAVKAAGGIDYAGNPQGYGTDVWLSLCLQRAGWRTLVDHDLVLQHHYHTTAETVPGFLSDAAKNQNVYLQIRLGYEWQAAVNALAQASL